MHKNPVSARFTSPKIKAALTVVLGRKCRVLVWQLERSIAFVVIKNGIPSLLDV